MGGLDSMVPSGQVVEKPVTPEAGPGRELKSRWFLVSFLCFYGFVAQMRPGESFITPYLLSPEKNFTQKQITNEITPVLSYSYMAVLVPIFLLTDYVRYKPVLVLQGLSYVSVWLLLLLGTTVLHMQFLEFFYSITMAARIAYSPYIFSLVQPVHYQRMAGYSRAAVLLGVFSSSVLGQLLVTVGGVSFTRLNYISLGFLVFSLVVALFLKRPKRSLFFNRSEPGSGAASPSEVDHMHPGPRPPGRRKLGPLRAAWRDCVLLRMLRELGASLQVPRLRLWSLWWVFNSTGYYLITYYAHILWAVVHSTPDSTAVYNGGVDAAATLLSAITSFAAGFVEIRWALWAELVIGIVTAVQAGLVFLLSSTSSIWLCYAAVVLFRGFYQFLVPIATFQIASSLSKELCALVFGVNTLLATILNTIITLIVSDKRGLGLSVHSQGWPSWSPQVCVQLHLWDGVSPVPRRELASRGLLHRCYSSQPPHHPKRGRTLGLGLSMEPCHPGPSTCPHSPFPSVEPPVVPAWQWGFRGGGQWPTAGCKGPRESSPRARPSSSVLVAAPPTWQLNVASN